MENLLTLSYYFTPNPGPAFGYTYLVLALGLALILIGVGFEVFRRKGMKDKIAKKLLRPYPGKLMRYGFLALFLLAVREAGIAYLSMRIWWFVLLAFMLYSGLKLALSYRKEYEKRAKKRHESKKEDKYLPRKKK